MGSELDGTIYGAAEKAVKSGLASAGETPGSFLGKVLLFFPKMIWKLLVLCIKLVGSIYYAIIGGVTCLFALLEKGLEKISFIGFFRFMYNGEKTYSENEDSESISKGKKVFMIIIKIFGSILYFFWGILTLVLRIFTQICNWFSWFKFYNNFLGI